MQALQVPWPSVNSLTGRIAVTGAAGQDGSYLTERLVADGYAVHAVVRSPVVATDGVSIHEVDLTDHDGLRRLVLGTAPDEVYNLGGISSVAQSWSEPVRTAEVSGVAVLAILQACLELQQSLGRPVRLLQASSAEIFGEPRTPHKRRPHQSVRSAPMGRLRLLPITPSMSTGPTGSMHPRPSSTTMNHLDGRRRS